jgi:hypothetical protein
LPDISGEKFSIAERRHPLNLSLPGIGTWSRIVIGIGTGKENSRVQVKSTVFGMYMNLKRTCLFIKPDATRGFPEVNPIKEVLNTYCRRPTRSVVTSSLGNQIQNKYHQFRVYSKNPHLLRLHVGSGQYAHESHSAQSEIKFFPSIYTFQQEVPRHFKKNSLGARILCGRKGKSQGGSKSWE